MHQLLLRLRNLAFGNQLHLPEKSRRFLRIATIAPSPAERERFLSAGDRDKAASSFFLYFRAFVTSSPALESRHHVFGESYYVYKVELATLRCVDCRQGNSITLRAGFFRTQSELLQKLFDWKVTTQLPRNFSGNFCPCPCVIC